MELNRTEIYRLKTMVIVTACEDESREEWNALPYTRLYDVCTLVCRQKRYVKMHSVHSRSRNRYTTPYAKIRYS